MRRTLLLLVLVAAARRGGACDCMVSTLTRSFERYDYVVRARVEQVLDAARPDSPRRTVYTPPRVGYHVRLRVLRAYKGQLPPAIQVGGLGGNCDFRFAPNQEYVLFLERRDKRYLTSTCALNFRPTDTASLHQVERLAAGKTAARLSP